MNQPRSIRDGFPQPRATRPGWRSGSRPAPRALAAIALLGATLASAACGEVQLTFTPTTDAGSQDAGGDADASCTAGGSDAECGSADGGCDGACASFDGGWDEGGIDAGDGGPSSGDGSDDGDWDGGWDAALDGSSDASLFEGG